MTRIHRVSLNILSMVLMLIGRMNVILPSMVAHQLVHPMTEAHLQLVFQRTHQQQQYTRNKRHLDLRGNQILNKWIMVQCRPGLLMDKSAHTIKSEMCLLKLSFGNKDSSSFSRWVLRNMQISLRLTNKQRLKFTDRDRYRTDKESYRSDRDSLRECRDRYQPTRTDAGATGEESSEHCRTVE